MRRLILVVATSLAILVGGSKNEVEEKLVQYYDPFNFKIVVVPQVDTKIEYYLSNNIGEICNDLK